MVTNIGTVAKAIVAGLTAFGGTYTVAMTDGNVSVAEWVSVAVATLIATAAVWAVPNAGNSTPEKP